MPTRTAVLRLYDYLPAVRSWIGVDIRWPNQLNRLRLERIARGQQGRRKLI
jgi:hypothetical protein